MLSKRGKQISEKEILKRENNFKKQQKQKEEEKNHYISIMYNSKFSNKLDEKSINEYIRVTNSFVPYHHFFYHSFSESFLAKNALLLNKNHWKVISLTQKLSFNFIYKYYKEIDINHLLKNKKVSKKARLLFFEVCKKNNKKVVINKNDPELIKNINFFQYYINCGDVFCMRKLYFFSNGKVFPYSFLDLLQLDI